MARKRRVLKIGKGEKLLYLGALFAFCLMALLKTFGGANISNLKMNIERINHEISAEQRKVESLTMTVNELTSFDNVKNIVKEMGLAYNNENIIIINK